MVDYIIPEEIQMICRGLRSFLEKEVQPLEEKNRKYLEDERARLQEDGSLVPEFKKALQHVRSRSAELGYYAMHMPQEVGGGGIGRVGMFYAFKEVFRRGPGLNVVVLSGPEGPSPMLLSLNESQREKYLTPLVQGEQTTCFALTEPEAGSDIKNLKTRAEKKGSHYILNGMKTFITNAVDADFAQVFAIGAVKIRILLDWMRVRAWLPSSRWDVSSSNTTSSNARKHKAGPSL